MGCFPLGYSTPEGIAREEAVSSLLFRGMSQWQDRALSWDSLNLKSKYQRTSAQDMSISGKAGLWGRCREVGGGAVFAESGAGLYLSWVGVRVCVVFCLHPTRKEIRQPCLAQDWMIRLWLCRQKKMRSSGVCKYSLGARANSWLICIE